jgi:hypothetical protein
MLPRLACLLSLIAFLAVAACGDSASDADRDAAIKEAESYFGTLTNHQDLSSGPCVAEHLPGNLSDWAVDVAHDPRQPVDDDPANQCQSFRDGDTHHFVELTPDGDLIRAQ